MIWNIRKQETIGQNNKNKSESKEMRTQRNIAQMEEQIKTPGKKNGHKQSIRCRDQNTGYRDTQGT